MYMPRIRRTALALTRQGYEWWTHVQVVPGSSHSRHYPVVRTPTGRLVTGGAVEARSQDESLAILVGLAHVVATQPHRIQPSPYPWAQGIIPFTV